MQRCIAYIRVSTVKQGEKGVSLQEQRRAITEYAARFGITLTDWFEEKETAAKRGRPAFSKVLSLLRKGKASGVVIHKIDRSARNLRDWADLGELIDAGVSVHIASESLDLQSRGGRLSADIQAVVASDYIRNLREETKKGIYGRLRQGLLPMAAPLGYLDKGPGKVKTIDPVRGPLVRQAFELYASGGYSLRTLREEVTRRGLRNRSGKPVALNSLSLILNNSFYMGLITVKRTGETYAGIHEPLIGARLFKSVQERLRGKTQVKTRRHVFTFRQAVRCASCGKVLAGELQKGHTYYRCHTSTCPLRCLREEAFDGAVALKLVLLQLSQEEQEHLAKVYQSVRLRSGEDKKAALRAVELQLTQIANRLMRLTDALIDGTLEKNLFEERKRRLLVEQKELEERRESLRKAVDDSETLREVFELGTTAWLSYIQGPPEEKRELVKSMTSNRELLPNGPSVKLSIPYSWIAERTPVPNGSPPRDEFRSLEKMPHAATDFSYLDRLVERILAWLREKRDSSSLG